MTHINIKISKAVATAEKDGIITTGMVGVPVSFMFDSWWDGLIVTAVFKGSGAPISVPLLGATETVVPWEVLKRPSTLLRIGAEGRLPDGTLVIPTTWATVGIVMSGANATDDLAKPPTPTAFDRIMSQIGNMNDLATEDKSSLVAAVNEAMEKGGGVYVSGASVGQIIKVAAVDDAGKPTAWEPADLPEQAQSDWEQNDAEQPNYVKNRPFYEKIDSVTLMPETQFSNLTHIYSPEIPTPADVNGEFINDFTISSDGTMIINTGDTVKVTFDGTVYECVRQGKWIGNQSLTSYAGEEDTGEPFLFSLETIPSFHTKSTDCVVKVEADISQIKKIDSKFLELPIAPGSGENSTIENCTANYDYYTKNTANGKYSHAEGASNSADGDCSHAEGFQCSASRDCSHAEGAGNKATGYYSHAEGGFGEASGYHAHSEGEYTKAIGDDSHSEGKGTIAKGKCQHVQGRYNVEDPGTNGMYAHIVGNGTDDDKRSNAHTLDWSGNAWFAGDVFVNGSSQNSGVKLLKTGEAIQIPSTASVGQALVVKAVDENGKPTMWKAVDMPKQVQSGKAKSQILINQTIPELTVSLSITLEHDFRDLTAIISHGPDGAALTVNYDGTALASKIGLLINTTDFGNNPQKVAYTDTSTKTWQTKMIGAEWSDDLSVFKKGFAVDIATGVGNNSYCFPFGGATAMSGTLGIGDNAPRTGKTVNIIVRGAYLNVGTRVVLWGEYYE